MSKQDIVDYVMETPQNTNKAVLESLVDSALEESQVQPDWNQNNPEAKDYIKNRIGYYTYELHDNFFDGGDLTQTIAVEFDETPLIEGGDYKIIYGDQEYELTCRASNQFSNRFLIVGMNFGSETGFNYPFQFYVSTYTNPKKLYVTISGDNIPQSKILKIEGLSWKKNVQIKKIPDKCINFYQSDWNEKDGHEKTFIKNKPEIYTPNIKTIAGDTISDNQKFAYLPNHKVYKIEVFSNKSTKVGLSHNSDGNSETKLISDAFTINKDTIGYFSESLSMTSDDRKYDTYTYPFSSFQYHVPVDAWRFNLFNERLRPYIKLSLQETLGDNESWFTCVVFYYFE